ncbi:hypothetical protein CYMTET_23563 [Cymbomonas tetramitiformis]|uniref:Uncharacterized protein n=1 Tax=Cymbomonas tetramitiformis TaxID=36881 RepID=A0AAE0FZ30_9CHLO|nr:hypothetical protein CYMTET_23563 [Cymbomonas tetramitiformis]
MVRVGQELALSSRIDVIEFSYHTGFVHATNMTVNGNSAENGGVFSHYKSHSLAIHDSSIMNCQAVEKGGVVQSENPTAVEIIRCVLVNNTGNYGGALYIKTGGGLNISSSSFVSNTAHFAGGGIYQTAASTVGSSISIQNSNLTNNSATYGGAIYSYFAATQSWSIKLEGCIAVGNHATKNAAVAYVHAGLDIVIKDSLVHQNSGVVIGAFYFVAATDHRTALVTSCIFTENYLMDGDGGAFYLSDTTDLTVIGSTLANNQAKGSGGSIRNDNGDIYIQDCIINNNTAPVAGAVTTKGAIMHISNTSLNYNVASQGEGGAIMLDGTHCVLNNTYFIGNQAKDGGAIHSTGMVALHIKESTLMGNSATATGGALSMLAPSAAESAESTGNTSVLLELESVLIEANFAGTGGGLYLQHVPAVEIVDSVLVNNYCTGSLGRGGGLLLETDQAGYMDVLRSNLTSNMIIGTSSTSLMDSDTGLVGGGIYIRMDGCGGALTVAVAAETNAGDKLPVQIRISQVYLIENMATKYGGGICMVGTGTVQIEHTEMVGNSIDGDSSCSYGATGGAVFLSEGASMNASHCIFNANSAGDGGAIAILQNSSLQMFNNSFGENYASNLGSVLFTETGNCSLADLDFIENYAPNSEAVFWTTSNIDCESCAYVKSPLTADDGINCKREDGIVSLGAAHKMVVINATSGERNIQNITINSHSDTSTLDVEVQLVDGNDIPLCSWDAVVSVRLDEGSEVRALRRLPGLGRKAYFLAA